jgi:hypothetical protein
VPPLWPGYGAGVKGKAGFWSFDADFTSAQVEGKTIMEYNNKKLQALLQEVRKLLPSEIAAWKIKRDAPRP